MSSKEPARVTLRPAAHTTRLRSPFEIRLPLRGSPELPNLLTAVRARGAEALDALAAAVSRAARLLEGIGEARTVVTAPAQATWSLRCQAGEKVPHDFVVTNSQSARLTGEIRSTDFYSDTKTRSAVGVVRFEPHQVDLTRGGAQHFRALVTVPRDAASGEVLRATFFIAGSQQFRLPVELHVGRTSVVDADT